MSSHVTKSLSILNSIRGGFLAFWFCDTHKLLFFFIFFKLTESCIEKPENYFADTTWWWCRVCFHLVDPVWWCISVCSRTCSTAVSRWRVWPTSGTRRCGRAPPAPRMTTMRLSCFEHVRGSRVTLSDQQQPVVPVLRPGLTNLHSNTRLIMPLISPTACSSQRTPPLEHTTSTKWESSRRSTVRYLTTRLLQGGACGGVGLTNTVEVLN